MDPKKKSFNKPLLRPGEMCNGSEHKPQFWTTAVLMLIVSAMAKPHNLHRTDSIVSQLSATHASQLAMQYNLQYHFSSPARLSNSDNFWSRSSTFSTLTRMMPTTCMWVKINTHQTLWQMKHSKAHQSIWHIREKLLLFPLRFQVLEARVTLVERYQHY